MGEVHHADDAEHHGVADGDQPIDRPQRDTVDKLLEENFHPLRLPPPGRRPITPNAKGLTGRGRSGNAERLPRVIKSRTVNGRGRGGAPSAYALLAWRPRRTGCALSRTPAGWLVQTAKQPDQHQNRDRNPKQPKQQVTSHHRSSSVWGGTRPASRGSKYIWGSKTFGIGTNSDRRAFYSVRGA